MGVTAKGKWILVAPTTTPVAKAARRSLQLRIEKVSQLLPRAAQDAHQNVELVHQLRVACRRASACLDAYELPIPRGKKNLRKRLKEIRRAAGPARDLDVLLQRQECSSASFDGSSFLGELLLERLRECRLAAQAALVEAAKPKHLKSLDRALHDCLQSIDESDDEEAETPFNEFAASQLERQTILYLRDFNRQDHTVAQLHALRISGKRLRYLIELFRSAISDSWRKSVYRRVADLQERLGRVNDHAVAQHCFQRLVAEMPPDELAAFTAGVIVAEHQSLTAASEEFFDWWTEQRRDDFKSLLLETQTEPPPDVAEQDAPPS